MASDQPIILWYRQDLRLTDHPALTAAAQSGRPIIPLFILDEAAQGDWPYGSAARWWLHHSLDALAHELQKKDLALILRRSATSEALEEIVKDTGAAGVYCTEHAEPWLRKLDDEVAGALGVPLRRFEGSTLYRLGAIRTQKGTYYKVFTQFWNRCLGQPEPEPPMKAPRGKQAPPKSWPDSEPLGDWGLLPEESEWHESLAANWEPGERGAYKRLRAFLNHRIEDYDDGRDRPDKALTSGLSPHLHWGEISPREVWHKTMASRADNEDPAGGAAEPFLRELGWREFSHHLLDVEPDLPDKPMRPEYRKFPWRTSEEDLKAWQRGLTGYPIVDAGMRQLLHAGWMHNRVRMIVGSFLIKDLRLHWKEGEAWFWERLVDADLGNNSMGWQWCAGSGPDAAPFFRIFNPVIQGERFDPEGAYIRYWLPELKDLPDTHIHAPWKAKPDVLDKAGVTLGDTYPEPIVNHSQARQEALDGFEKVKQAKAS